MSRHSRAGEAKREQAGGNFLDDRHHVDIVGMETLSKRGTFSAPLDREAEHLALPCVKEAP